jgi:hypothetical protein
LRQKNDKSRWLNQLNTEGLRPEWIVIQTLQDPEILSQAERFWTTYFRTMGCPLTNSYASGPAFSVRHRQNLAIARLTRSAGHRQVLLQLLASDAHATDLDLGQRMGLKPRMVRKHLKELRDSGMITASVKRHLVNGQKWMNHRTIVVTSEGLKRIKGC